MAPQPGKPHGLAGLGGRGPPEGELMIGAARRRGRPLKAVSCRCACDPEPNPLRQPRRGTVVNTGPLMSSLMWCMESHARCVVGTMAYLQAVGCLAP